MTRATKDKIFNIKNLRVLIIVSICALVLCVAILPVITFNYSKNRFGIDLPPKEENANNVNIDNNSNQVQNSTDDIAWCVANTDMFYYSAVGNGTEFYISGIKENAVFETDYVILPDQMSGGGNIVGISDNAFENVQLFKGLVVPNVYKYVGVDAFKGNIKINQLVIGNTMEETAEALNGRELLVVENGAFDGCVNLETITIGRSVLEVKECFSDCINVKSIIIYSTSVYEGLFTKTFAGGIFEVCESVFIYANAYTGNNSYFSKYYTMTQVNIGGKYYNKFQLEQVLYEITLDACGGVLENNEIIVYEPNSKRELPTPVLENFKFEGWYKSPDFVGSPFEGIEEDTKGCFTLYAKWSEVKYNIHYVLSGGANDLANTNQFAANSDDLVFRNATKPGYMFGGWYSDSNYNNKVTKLSDLTLDGLHDVTVYAKFDAMFNCVGGYLSGITDVVRANTTIVVPALIDGMEVSMIGEGAFSNCLAEEIVIEGNIYKLQKEAFKNCVNLKTVTINSHVLNEIGASAFSGCISLETFNFTDLVGLNKLGESAFYNCKALKVVDLRQTKLMGVAVQAFMGCSSLTTVYLPTNTRNIYGSAFSGCTKLIYLNFESLTQLASFGSKVFENCTALASVKLVGNITQLTEGLFRGCNGLKTVDLSSLRKLTSIGVESFADCTELQSISIRDGLAKLSSGAFKNCKSLTEISLPMSLTMIGEGAFSGAGITSVVFADPSNWYLVESENDSIEGVTPLMLSDKNTNAVNLKSEEYKEKILIKDLAQ